MNKKINLKEVLVELEKIVSWFENQKDLDLEEGLEKVKIAMNYLKEAKSKLKDIENEFKKIKSEAEDSFFKE
jgi:exonuclease VII small subunit